MAIDYDDFEWIGDDPRDVPAEVPDGKEAGRPWSEVRPEWLALIDRTFPN